MNAEKPPTVSTVSGFLVTKTPLAYRVIVNGENS